MLLDVRARGVTMVLVEQNVGFGLRLSGAAFLPQRGTVVHKGPAAELDSEKLAYHLGAGRLLGACSPAWAKLNSDKEAGSARASWPRRVVP
jgi:hypothetical protein